MKKKLGNLIKIIGKLMMLTVLVSGCVDVPSEYEIQLTVDAKIELEEKTRDVLDKAINEIGAQPDKWEDTLKNTIDELGQVSVDTATEILKETRSVLENATGYVGSEARCDADFIGRRVQIKLQQIRFDIFGGEKPDLYPVICSITPTELKPEDKDIPIKYFGYDFSGNYNSDDFRVDLEDKWGNIMKRDIGNVNIAHNYFLQVVLQGEDFTGLDPKKYPTMVLKWKDTNVIREDKNEEWRSEIPIILPEPVVSTPLYKSDAFSVHHYAFTGSNKLLTDLPNDTLDCGIFGFNLHGQSIDWTPNFFMKDESLQVYLRKAGRYWEVITQPGKGSNTQPMRWDIDVLCIKKENKDAYELMTISANGGSSVPTSKSAMDYVCGIVGIQLNTNPTTIDTSRKGEKILAAYPVVEKDNWSINVDMALGSQETWTVNVLCLRKDTKYIVYPVIDENDYFIDLKEGETTRLTEILSNDLGSLECGIIGFEALQKATEIRYKSMYYDSQNNPIVTVDPQAICSYDCTILDVRMLLPKLVLPITRAWEVEAQLMWGEIREIPGGAETYLPAICGCTIFSCPDDCGGNMVRTTRYDSIFYSTTWKVRPLCVLVNRKSIQQVHPNPVP